MKMLEFVVECDDKNVLPDAGGLISLLKLMIFERFDCAGLSPPAEPSSESLLCLHGEQRELCTAAFASAVTVLRLHACLLDRSDMPAEMTLMFFNILITVLPRMCSSSTSRSTVEDWCIVDFMEH